MSEFKPINTQEEFESALAERLAQKERSVASKYESYTSPEDLEKLKGEYEEKYKDYSSKEDVQKLKDEYDARIAKYESDSEKTRIASQYGIPAHLASRLKGKTKEEIEEDAKALAGYFQKEPPMAKGERTVLAKEQQTDASLKKLLKGINKGE